MHYLGSMLQEIGKQNFQKSFIMDVYNAFYLGQKIDEEAYNALLDVADAAVVCAESDNNVWRAVLTPVCYSVGWQIPQVL